jgi:glycosyltransferase involved in cell wall biosynthesis
VLTWLKQRLLVLDVFMSLYLIASERGLTERHRFTAWLVFELEKVACLLPDMLILDTEEYVRWFQNVYGLDPGRFRLVPTGADDQHFHPLDAREHRDGIFRVLYYGTFIPNHGVEYIVQAANLLKDDPAICFELVGEGPSKSYAMDMVEKQGLTNVSFTSWIDKHELPYKIAEADVCLGAFGTTPQSMMTVQNKIYEGLAMGKPVITGDAPLMRSVFAHGEHLYLCDRADPQALADAIRVLRDDENLRKHMAESGHRAFETGYTIERTGEALVRYLYESMER